MNDKRNRPVIRNEIIIFRETGAGRMYLCEDRCLSSDISEASRHWESQFEAIVAENWILNAGGTPGFEIVGSFINGYRA